MKIGITGISGFIGREIARQARKQGHAVVGFSRTPSRQIPEAQELRVFDVNRPPDLSGLDAVIHLAGESILGYWTREKRRRIRDSRVLGTRAVAAAFRATDTAPRKLVSCSAVGYYGDTGESECDETSPPGCGFLAEVAEEWEAAALEAGSESTRVALLRVGFVLGAQGGAMNLIRPVFRLGLGGRLGSGRQWMSPIHVEDVAGLFLAAAGSHAFEGPINACLPEPCRNSDFTRAVARRAHRPALFPTPAFAMRLALGEFADVALASLRVVPRRAMEQGFPFRHPTLESAVAASFPGTPPP